MRKLSWESFSPEYAGKSKAFHQTQLTKKTSRGGLSLSPARAVAQGTRGSAVPIMAVRAVLLWLLSAHTW